MCEESKDKTLKTENYVYLTIFFLSLFILSQF